MDTLLIPREIQETSRLVTLRSFGQSFHYATVKYLNIFWPKEIHDLKLSSSPSDLKSLRNAHLFSNKWWRYYSGCNNKRFPAGGAGEKLLMPGTGFLTVGAASALTFCQVLREEYPDVSCKLNQVCVSLSAPESHVVGVHNK